MEIQKVSNLIINFNPSNARPLLPSEALHAEQIFAVLEKTSFPAPKSTSVPSW